MSAAERTPVARPLADLRPHTPAPPNPRNPLNGRGFTKHDAGKPKFSLMPPDVVLELAQMYALGAAKYGPRNMERGADWSRYYDAAMRHLLAWWGGEEFDPEDGQPHLMAAAFSLFTLRWYERHEAGSDDRPAASEAD